MRPSKRINSIFESVFKHRIAVGEAMPREAVAELIRRLAPFETDRGLIRVGPSGDGGYLLPDDLDGLVACISPGVSTESGFDLEIAQRGIDIYMADASVEGSAISHPRFHFEKKFLGPVSSGEFITIKDYCRSIPAIASSGDLLMQMDIEGAEYAVLLSMDRTFLSRFRIIVLELHGLENMFFKFSFALIKATLDKLLQDHSVVHLHPNNCCGSVVSRGLEIPRVMEVTFYRNDRATFTRDTARNYPHPLDSDNFATGRRELVLPVAWR